MTYIEIHAVYLICKFVKKRDKVFMQMPLLKGRYLPLSRLGKGGMGVVYKAADASLGNRPVAIKEMSQRHLQLREIASVTAIFQREALLLASLSHQNLPRIYDFFSEHGNSYLVMDDVSQDTFRFPLRKLF